jgi:copper chaperone CopZ
MNSAWVFTHNPNEVPEWMKQQPTATEVKKLKKLEVKVVMCCNTCVEKVEDAVRGMHGVFDCKTDRWNDLLTIELTPGGSLDHDKLVRKLKRATHDRKVKILESKSSSEEKKTPTTTTTTVVYRNPYMGPGYNGGLVPWPTSSASSSNPPFITNPFYLQHPVGCGHCYGYPGAVCGNCGRGSELGARFH